jgi:hypothetical protein
MSLTAELSIPRLDKLCIKDVEDCKAPINPVPAGPKRIAITLDLTIFNSMVITDEPPIMEVDFRIDFELLNPFF